MPVLIACLPGGAFAEAQLAKILVNVCIGIGAAVVGWAVSSAISGNWDVDELRSALANAIFFTGVTVFISTSVSTLKYVGREPNAAADLAECAGNCFRKGTLVETADGLKSIEDIEVGDKVLAYDPETGEQAYKPVVRLFRNATDKWYHVHVNKQDITCTAEHPFYVADIDEFVPAKDLKAGQHVLLSDGSYTVIDGILVEELSTPEATYNFEVEDYHTYYVSKDKVLVHNMCKNDYKLYSPEKIADKYGITVEDFHGKVKKKILTQVKPNYKVGRNPDILLNSIGDIAYQGAKGASFSKGFQVTGLNIADVIQSLGLGG